METSSPATERSGATLRWSDLVRRPAGALASSYSLLARFASRLPARLTALGGVSVLASLAEAAVLVVVVHVAFVKSRLDDAPNAAPFLGDTLSIGGLLVIAVLLAVMTLALHLAEARISAKVVAEVTTMARRQSAQAFLNASWGVQSNEPAGTLQEATSTLSLQAANLAITFATAVAAMLNLATFLTAALVIDPLATLAVIGVGVVLFAALSPVARMTQQRATEWVDHNAAYGTEVATVSDLVLELHAFGRRDEAADRLEIRHRPAAASLRNMRETSAFGASLYKDVALLMVVAGVTVIYYYVDTGLAAVSTVALLMLRSIAAAQRLQANLQTVREQEPSVRALTVEIDRLSGSRVVAGDHPLDRIERVELRDVAYRYPGGDHYATEQLSLEIERGEAIGVVGTSGGGKSTFVQLLLRLRTPSSGGIFVNDVDYREFAETDWRQLVAVVPQDPHLFDGTIAENISFFRHHTTEEVRAAAERAHLLHDVEALPRGLDTKVGPRGVGLSGGQRQRIAIARALAGQPALLVLDEPTSALDGVSEEAITATIRALHGTTTMVIIAHRLSTVASCDRIVTLEHGRIVSIRPPSLELGKNAPNADDPQGPEDETVDG